MICRTQAFPNSVFACSISLGLPVPGRGEPGETVQGGDDQGRSVFARRFLSTAAECHGCPVIAGSVRIPTGIHFFVDSCIGSGSP